MSILKKRLRKHAMQFHISTYDLKETLVFRFSSQQMVGHTQSPLLHQQSGHEGNNLVSALITRMFAADAENIN